LLFDWTFVDVEVKGPRPELPDNICQRVQADLMAPRG